MDAVGPAVAYVKKIFPPPPPITDSLILLMWFLSQLWILVRLLAI